LLDYRTLEEEKKGVLVKDGKIKLSFFACVVLATLVWYGMYFVKQELKERQK